MYAYGKTIYGGWKRWYFRLPQSDRGGIIVTGWTLLGILMTVIAITEGGWWFRMWVVTTLLFIVMQVAKLS